MDWYYLRKIKNDLICLLSIPFSPKKVNISEQEAYATLQSYWPDPGSSCYVDKTRKKVKSVSGGGLQLSMIIPSYNNEKYIVDAIESVLKQKTNFTWELIVVDDGSTDNTKELLKPYRDMPNVIIVEQENNGSSVARNTGLDLATGEYIMFIDSDDQLLPDAIERLMSAAYRNHANVVAGGYCSITESGEVHSRVNLPTGWMNPMGNVYGMSWGKVYKRELFDNLRFPKGYWFQDSIFEQIVWPQCKKIYTIQEAVYLYLRGC